MGEITSTDRKAATASAASLPLRSRKKRTVEVRKETITSVASEPIACTRSARASSKPRRSEARKPSPSTRATGTASPKSASHTTAGSTTL